MNIGSNTDIELGAAFSLALAAADLPKLEELILLVNYAF